MFNKRRPLIPTRKDSAKEEPRPTGAAPRIDLPSFKPDARTPRPGAPQTAKPVERAAAPAAQPARPVSLPRGAGLPRGAAQPGARPVAQPVAAPSAAPPILPPGAGGAAASAASQAVGRVMLVGPDIRLSAEISACERLVVEGAVEGELSEAECLEIAHGGRFRGTAEVESCVVDGLFEGELTVHGVLALKANGRVSGTVRYGAIEIERGGTIAGNFGRHGAPEGAAALRTAGNGAAAGRRPA